MKLGKHRELVTAQGRRVGQQRRQGPADAAGAGGESQLRSIHMHREVSPAMLQVQGNERTAHSTAHSSVYMMGVSQGHMHAPKSDTG